MESRTCRIGWRLGSGGETERWRKRNGGWGRESAEGSGKVTFDELMSTLKIFDMFVETILEITWKRDGIRSYYRYVL